MDKKTKLLKKALKKRKSNPTYYYNDLSDVSEYINNRDMEYKKQLELNERNNNSEKLSK